MVWFPFLLKFSLCSMKNPISLHLGRFSVRAAGQGDWVFADNTGPPSLCPRIKSRWQAGLWLTQPTGQALLSSSHLHREPLPSRVPALPPLPCSVLPGIPCLHPLSSLGPFSELPVCVGDHAHSRCVLVGSLLAQSCHAECADQGPVGALAVGASSKTKGKERLSTIGVQHGPA